MEPRFCAVWYGGRDLPHACAPYRPQEKGQVENLVGFIKSSFFNAHTFENRAALEEKLASWHKRSNDERVCRATKEIPRARLLLESGRLKPLGISPYGYRLRFSRVVRPDGFVEFEGLRYFASLKRVGQTINLRVGAGDVLLELQDRIRRASQRCPPEWIRLRSAAARHANAGALRLHRWPAAPHETGQVLRNSA